MVLLKLKVKRYGMIFTCLASRAVYLEIAHSLDTHSCIASLRRGVVKYMRSDNGTVLVGAERELREKIQNTNSKVINDHLINKGIEWEFNPPANSHFGGV